MVHQSIILLENMTCLPVPTYESPIMRKYITPLGLQQLTALHTKQQSEADTLHDFQTWLKYANCNMPIVSTSNESLLPQLA